MMVWSRLGGEGGVRELVTVEKRRENINAIDAIDSVVAHF